MRNHSINLFAGRGSGKCLIFPLLLALVLAGLVHAQAQPFSRRDSLRGALNGNRICYDVLHYDLEVKVEPSQHRIAGRNTVHFRVLKPFKLLQIDLDPGMTIARIEWRKRSLPFTREHSAVWVQFPELLFMGQRDSFTVFYGGAPREAPNPPWDGGFVWRVDDNGKDWIGVACEGIGASSWWPLKDHPSDEPDSVRISVITPKDLMAVCNGQFRGAKKVAGGYLKWQWAVTYPINPYNVTLNVGDYVQFEQDYQSRSGKPLRLRYYVLRDDEQKAKAHFRQVIQMLQNLEKLLGPYPFPRDGYALVQSSYWGMEHQSAIAYGNNFKNNEWGFDFIILHESAHEWFGNSLSAGDHAELWIHESFATYTEALYVERLSGKEMAEKYLLAQRAKIKNLTPMLGPVQVAYNGWKDSDIYYKGAWMLHSLRNALANDSLWFETLRAFVAENRLKILGTPEVIAFFNKRLKADYTALFYQYLRHTELPVFEYEMRGKGKKIVIAYRWSCQEPGFNLPLEVIVNDRRIALRPTTEWQLFEGKELDPESFYADENRGLFESRQIFNTTPEEPSNGRQ